MYQIDARRMPGEQNRRIIKQSARLLAYKDSVATQRKSTVKTKTDNSLSSSQRVPLESDRPSLKRTFSKISNVHESNDSESATRAPRICGPSTVAPNKAKDHDKYCHFCQHVKVSMLACETQFCSHRFCTYCLTVHLGDDVDPENSPAWRNGQWSCPTCRNDCCCSSGECSRSHRHCKAFRYRCRRATAATLRTTAAHALVSLAGSSASPASKPGKPAARSSSSSSAAPRLLLPALAPIATALASHLPAAAAAAAAAAALAVKRSEGRAVCEVKREEEEKEESGCGQEVETQREEVGGVQRDPLEGLVLAAMAGRDGMEGAAEAGRLDARTEEAVAEEGAETEKQQQQQQKLRLQQQVLEFAMGEEEKGVGGEELALSVLASLSALARPCLLGEKGERLVKADAEDGDCKCSSLHSSAPSTPPRENAAAE
mmetsp:Transcript_15998/g.31970  ORF Transcript_15998/g.31970 Transcript_15998/m.31970 type:complete len:430 (+) Transcript_15998:281-1570(+)